MKADPELERYASWGYASAIPGLEMAVDIIQRELHTIRQKLGELQNPPPQARGRPSGSGWSDDPAERSREMKRRLAVRRARKQRPGHPRDPEHPGHKAWLAKMRKVTKRNWDALSPAERQDKLNRMKRGRGIRTLVA